MHEGGTPMTEQDVFNLRKYAETTLRLIDELEKWKKYSISLHSENQCLRKALEEIAKDCWELDHEDIKSMARQALSGEDKGC
jgi:hypothetical protein